MALYTLSCPSCNTTIKALSLDKVCPDCGSKLQKELPKARIYVSARDMAVNHSENARYKEWFNSPEVQEKLRSGEYQREGNNSNNLSDDLNCLEDGT